MVVVDTLIAQFDPAYAILGSVVLVCGFAIPWVVIDAIGDWCRDDDQRPPPGEETR